MKFEDWWEKNGDYAGQCVREEEAKGIWDAAQDELLKEIEARNEHR